MFKRSTDELFQLLKSLEKAEKRNFKLYVQRNSGSSDLKIIQLFDALDKMEDYDEELLLRKNKGIQKQQLPNLKAHLYKQMLASLRILKDDNNIDIQLHEYMDYARILYNKGLPLQSLKTLDRIKEIARSNNQVTFWLQALIFEKKIEALHITRSIENRAEMLSKEVNELNARLIMIGKLSNLSLQLYGWYIKNGHARNEKDSIQVKIFFENNLPDDAKNYDGFYERLYLYQSYCWYGFILQDLLLYYRYCQKWIDLFEKENFMQKVEPLLYIKGLHNLLNAHFMLQNHAKFNETLGQFENFHILQDTDGNYNSRIQTFIYLYIARLNKHFMEGTFTEGLTLVPYIEEKLEEFKLQLDVHRVLVFYYKIASLYFGSGDFEKTIDFLNRIINRTVDLRTDLQCYARLLHLIAQYELGNYEIMEYLIKSVYRFMARMENLSYVENEIFRFLRNSFRLKPQQIKPALIDLKARLKEHEHDKFETRAYMYLDIVSWLESKIENKPVQKIIREKFLKRKGLKSA